MGTAPFDPADRNDQTQMDMRRCGAERGQGTPKGGEIIIMSTDMTSTEQQTAAKHTRLSVNLSLETTAVLKDLIKRKGISLTDGIRRAIAVWKFIEDEVERGNTIAVVEPDGKVREVVLLSG